jgi:hypothetical protein
LSLAAATFYAYAKVVASCFGVPYNLRFQPSEEWKQSVTEKEARIAGAHLALF